MATKKTRAQLQSESDATFLDNSSGQIIPQNHRTYNDNVGESVANLKDQNTFEGQNIFEDTVRCNAEFQANGVSDFALQATFSGLLQSDGGANFTEQVTMTAQFVENQVSTAITIVTNEVDLTNVEGNSIFIQGGDPILNWVGNVGAIFNATFYENVFLDSQGGATILPNQNIQIKGGDTLIFRFRGVNQIQVLGLKRYAGDFFQLNALQDFQDLITAQALQIGAYYLIPSGYDVWSTLWDIIFFAKTQGSFDGNNVRVAADKGFYINVQQTEGDESNALQIFQFPSYVNYTGSVSYSNLKNDQVSDPRYDKGATATLLDGDYVGDIRMDSKKEPIFKNIQNLKEAEQPYFGRYLVSSINPYEPTFYPHSGTSLGGWGNAPYFEDGLTAINLLELNDGSLDLAGNNSITSIDDLKANYFVVNDIVTINFYVLVQGKMNQNPDGHSLYLYFPLPFQCLDKFTSSGHGVIRNLTDANFPDQGAIVTYEPNFPEKYCIFSAKHDNTIGVLKEFMISGTFTYTSTESL